MTAGPDDEQVATLCRALNEHRVAYVVFGSYAGRLQGADLRTVDVDIVPEKSERNLQRLCDALNSLDPRWRVEDVSPGLRIDGGRLEPRHILGSSVALGLVTSAGLVDIVNTPKGFERGYADLAPSAVIVQVGDTAVSVGALPDLILSKQLLDREKDREHLPSLLARQSQLERAREQARGPADEREPDLGIGF